MLAAASMVQETGSLDDEGASTSPAPRRSSSHYAAEPPGDFLRLSYTMVEPGWVGAAVRIVARIILSRIGRTEARQA